MHLIFTGGNGDERVMQGRSNRCMARGLALLVILSLLAFLSVASEANAQVVPDDGYAYLGPATPSADGYTTRPASFNRGYEDLAKEVAELREWQASLERKAAASKKRASWRPTHKIGGRIFVDTAMFNQNAASVAQVGDAENGTEFRAAWIYVKGKVFNIADYKIQFDIAGSTLVDSGGGTNNKRIGQVLFKDVYMGLSELPLLGHLRVGHFKEPFGMEQLISGRFTTFMERSLGDTGVFVPGRNLGVMAFDCVDNERMTWAVGCFVNKSPPNPPRYQSDEGQGAFTMRLTYLPWYDEASHGRGLLHVGAAYSYRANGNDTLRLAARPESHLAPFVLDTGTLANVPDYQIYSGELALVYGSFSAQAEYFGVALNRDGGLGKQNFNGCYVNLSYFLTGENRVYVRQAGTFNRCITPFENFFRVRDANGCTRTGIGAWELAYRYSYGDVIDGPVNGGRTGDHTFGLNWYLNPYMRMMFNYIHSTTNDATASDGKINIVQMRAQFDF